MYMLASQELADLASRDPEKAIARWLHRLNLGARDVFVSVISLGILASSIEDLPRQRRDEWRRLLAEARRTFQDTGGILDVDLRVVDIWATQLKAIELFEVNHVSGDTRPLGEDERLVIATAIAHGHTLVSRPRAYLDEICENTTLTVVTP